MRQWPQANMSGAALPDYVSGVLDLRTASLSSTLPPTSSISIRIDCRSKLRPAHSQSAKQSIERFNGWIALTPFYLSHVGAMNSGPVPQFFLRETTSLSKGPHYGTENLTGGWLFFHHRRELACVMTIGLQTISSIVRPYRRTMCGLANRATRKN